MAVAKLVTANEGNNVARLWFHRGDGALHQRFLLQTQGYGHVLLTDAASKGTVFALCRLALVSVMVVAPAKPRSGRRGQPPLGIFDRRALAAATLGLGLRAHDMAETGTMPV